MIFGTSSVQYPLFNCTPPPPDKFIAWGHLMAFGYGFEGHC